ncbi:MAG: hypothetical protein AAF604_09745 [Acidobacteriota bacterium]
MPKSQLGELVSDLPPIQAVFVTVMPDCLLYDSWMKSEEDWEVEDVAAYFGDLVRANREGLKSLGSWSDEMQVTIESADKLIVMREIQKSFVCSCVFEQGTALGMVRLHLRRLLERLPPLLPTFEVEERPRGVRILEFLQRYAPDPHAVLLRASLRTGLSLDQLQSPADLEAEEVERLEAAATRILGLRALNL